ncbi:hypothetical protein [Flagellimonas marinaquae]
MGARKSICNIADGTLSVFSLLPHFTSALHQGTTIGTCFSIMMMVTLVVSLMQWEAGMLKNGAKVRHPTTPFLTEILVREAFA